MPPCSPPLGWGWQGCGQLRAIFRVCLCGKCSLLGCGERIAKLLITAFITIFFPSITRHNSHSTRDPGPASPEILACHLPAQRHSASACCMPSPRCSWVCMSPGRTHRAEGLACGLPPAHCQALSTGLQGLGAHTPLVPRGRFEVKQLALQGLSPQKDTPSMQATSQAFLPGSGRLGAFLLRLTQPDVLA